jgi:hypothetical protein
MTTALLFPGPMTIALVSSIVLAVALFTLPDTPLLLATSALGGFAVAVVGLIAPLVAGPGAGIQAANGVLAAVAATAGALSTRGYLGSQPFSN